MNVICFQANVLYRLEVVAVCHYLLGQQHEQLTGLGNHKHSRSRHYLKIKIK